ncbi:VOC family protein [Planctomonas deserti]|uniref:VOC family protein n=1 Tax=Planctomonas deserti TaxID=2144185 RepID=UPI000D3A0537|nr:VOC family protein [Planctomonas deserti]
MPTRAFTPSGAPIWIELYTREPTVSARFYSQLFGWTTDTPAEENGYIACRLKGSVLAGISAADVGSGAPEGWLVYLASPDACATSAAAETHGGDVLVEPLAIGSLGTMALVADPGDALVGVWQPGDHPGTEIVNEDGAPVWHEVEARNYAASLDFYRNAFLWETEVESDTDEFRYCVQVFEGRPYAGIMDADALPPEDGLSRWRVYFQVADVDRACADAVRLGGTVRGEPEDTPYGRMAELADPVGAVFNVMDPAED